MMRDRLRNARLAFQSYQIIATRLVFTALRYASAVYAVVVCLSVCPSIRLSHASIMRVWKFAANRKKTEKYHLHSLRWHSATNWNVAMLMEALRVAMIFVHHVEIW